MKQLMATADTRFGATATAAGFSVQPAPDVSTLSREAIAASEPIALWLNRYHRPLSGWPAAVEEQRTVFVAELEDSTGAQWVEDDEFYFVTDENESWPDLGKCLQVVYSSPHEDVASVLGFFGLKSATWQTRIEAANTPEEIFGVLRLFGYNKVADRLVYLGRLSDDDPDEPQMQIESLRGLADFITSEQELPDPQIGVNPDGLTQIEWQIPPNGILAMEFLSSDLIRFAAISAPARKGVDRLNVNGTLPKAAALDAVRPFTSHLEL